jgi:hypothetical protein
MWNILVKGLSFTGMKVRKEILTGSCLMDLIKQVGEKSEKNRVLRNVFAKAKKMFGWGKKLRIITPKKIIKKQISFGSLFRGERNT